MLIFVGMLANTVVIMAIAGERKMRNSPMYLLLANLAFADYVFLLSTLTSIVLVGFDLTSGANAYLFSISSYVATAALTVSIYTNVAVCIERYVTVAHPLHFKRIFHPTRVAGFIVFLWVIVSVYYIPHFVPPSSCPTLNGTDDGS
ncbi:Protein NPR-15, partial [Aphelenchoides avenae]